MDNFSNHIEIFSKMALFGTFLMLQGDEVLSGGRGEIVGILLVLMPHHNPLITSSTEMGHRKPMTIISNFYSFFQDSSLGNGKTSGNVGKTSGNGNVGKRRKTSGNGDRWKIVGRSLGDRWKIVGRSLEDRWEIVGRSLGDRWEIVGEIVGRSLGDRWGIPGHGNDLSTISNYL
jgi:hypothetical protein